MEAVPLQVTVGGMGAAVGAGGSISLLGMYQPDSGVLLIDEAVLHAPGTTPKRDGQSLVLTNMPSMAERDMLFCDDDTREAIDAFFGVLQRGLLQLSTGMEVHHPQSRIEPDGVDDRGRKYRVAPSITDGQMAVILMAWLAAQQDKATAQLDAFDDFAELSAFTVGLPESLGGRSRGFTEGVRKFDQHGWPVGLDR